MNYEIWATGDGSNLADYRLGVIMRDPSLRPLVGEEISIRGRVFRILRCTPSANPTDVMVKYFVSPPNPNRPFRRPSD